MAKKKQLNSVFTTAYQNNLWEDYSSVSGPGSNNIQTRIIKKSIPDILVQFKINKMLDAPCGDFFWMKNIIDFITSQGVIYTGVDIVKELIVTNSEKYGNKKVTFLNLDIVEESIPQADLILTRDCFIHLSFANIYQILRNFKKSGSKYLLLSTYTNSDRINRDVDGSGLPFRALNMQKFPFLFREPLMVINEGCVENEGKYIDKSLALWELSKINLFRIHFNLRLMAFKKGLIEISRPIRNIIKF